MIRDDVTVKYYKTVRRHGRIQIAILAVATLTLLASVLVQVIK